MKRMIWRRVVLSVVMCAVIFGDGCTPSGPANRESSEITGIDIGVQNLGTKRIEDVSVAFDDYRFTFGVIAPGKKAVHVCSEQVVPESADIMFELEDGRKFKKSVAVKKSLPASAANDLVLHFNIDDKQDVNVQFLHFTEVKGRAKLVAIPGRAEAK